MVLYTHTHSLVRTDQDYPLQSYYEHLVAIKHVNYGYSELRYIININPHWMFKLRKKRGYLKRNFNILKLMAS